MSWNRWLPAALLCALWAGPLAAQDVIDPVIDLDFDSPESWAMKYFTSVSLITPLGPAASLEPGAVDLGLEVIQVPHLDREQRTVGFGGFKEEDLNRSPAWARIRLTVGLPAGFGLTLGWAPPVEIGGVEADLLALVVEKRLLRRGPFELGLRGYGQVGDARGDFTCSEGGDHRFAAGSPQNPFGCQEPSRDQVTLEYLGIELVAAYRWRGERGPVVHFGVAGNRLDMEFQVNALTFGLRDRTLERADGDTLSFDAGVTWGVGQRGRFAVELFYSPLDVQRRGEPSAGDDPLLNVRALFSHRLR